MYSNISQQALKQKLVFLFKLDRDFKTTEYYLSSIS